jgi:hypothetical protein
VNVETSRIHQTITAISKAALIKSGFSAFISNLISRA